MVVLSTIAIMACSLCATKMPCSLPRRKHWNPFCGSFVFALAVIADNRMTYFLFFFLWFMSYTFLYDILEDDFFYNLLQNAVFFPLNMLGWNSATASLSFDYQSEKKKYNGYFTFFLPVICRKTTQSLACSCLTTSQYKENTFLQTLHTYDFGHHKSSIKSR
jgi:hypothetical protein